MRIENLHAYFHLPSSIFHLLEVIPASMDGIDRAIDVLRSGGVIAHATETCYGFACDLTNPEAVVKLFAVKKRPLDQPVSALFSSIEEARKFVVFSEKAFTLAEKYLPGALTLVLPQKKSAPFPLRVCPTSFSILNSPFSISLGVRLSSHPLARSIADRFGKPIATTSANLHGSQNPYSIAEIESQFLGRDAMPDLLIDSGKLPLTPPSTVVEVIGDRVRTLRQGDLLL